MTEAPVIAAAMARLVRAPTHTLIGERPGAITPLSQTEVAGWHSAGALTNTQFVRRLAAAYSADAGTAHLAVGGTCGIQTYAARFVVVVLGTWLQTGLVPDLRPEAWAFALDDAGHTVAVDPPIADSRPVATVEQVADLVLEHLRPFADTVRTTTRITERVALSSVAAACSGAFSAIHRCMRAEDRPAVARLADRFLASPALASGGHLLDRREVHAPGGPVLVHERRVCCLIRLGSHRGTCHTCPDLEPAERRAGVVERAAAAQQSQELRLAPTVSLEL